MNNSIRKYGIIINIEKLILPQHFQNYIHVSKNSQNPHQPSHHLDLLSKVILLAREMVTERLTLRWMMLEMKLQIPGASHLVFDFNLTIEICSVSFV